MQVKLTWGYLILSFVFFIQCNTNDDPGESLETPSGLAECLITTGGNSLEIVTWNVKDFPLDGEKTITEITKIIKELNPDLIAFQEITTGADLDILASNLAGWDHQIKISSGINLGFLIKSSEVTVIEDIVEIMTDDFYAFPRPPVQIKISHPNGLSVTIVNIHLKCCGGQENILRRKDASVQLKAYIDSNYADEEVILLGDYNNEISQTPGEENVFYNFIEDNQNYSFADMEIALGNSASWSYPSWPSHIDHILITDELADNVMGVFTLPIDDCNSQYLDDVSDHRPLILQLKQD